MTKKLLKVALTLGFISAVWGQEFPTDGYSYQGGSSPSKGEQISTLNDQLSSGGAKPIKNLAVKTPVNADYELQLWETAGGIGDGSTHKIRATYSQVSPDGKTEIKGTFSEYATTVVIGDREWYFNEVLSGAYMKTISQTETSRLAWYAGADLALFSFDAADRDGLDHPLGVNVRGGAKYLMALQEGLKVGGIGQLQQSYRSKGWTTDIGVGGMAGLPLGNLAAINLSVLYRHTLFAIHETLDNNGKTVTARVDFDKLNVTPHSLVTGINGTYYFTDAFGVNAGFKYTWLIDGSDMAINIGGNFAL